MRLALLTLVLAGCPMPEPDDSGAKADDSGAPDDTGTAGPTDLDPLFAGEPRDVWGCGWAYVVAEYDDATLVADLGLPEDDRFADADVAYARGLGVDDDVRVGTGTGPDSLDVFDCGDVMERLDGVEVYVATAGDLTVDATFVREVPEWTCDGASPNPLYDTHVAIANLQLEDARGATATLTSFEAEVGLVDYCGG